MVRRLVKRNEELEAENKTLRASFALLEGQLKDLETKLEKSETERRLLELMLRNLRGHVFGRRSEKLAPGQTEFDFMREELFREAEEELKAEDGEEEPKKPKKPRGGRRPIPKHIPRERVVLDVDPELRSCTSCQCEMARIGEEITEELEHIPAQLFVREYVRPKYSCPKCHDGVLVEPLPKRPIEKGRPGPGLLSHVVVSKYSDHLPLHRQEKIFRRSGINLPRSTLCDWIAAVALLLAPVKEALKREILSSTILQADETPTPVRDPKVKGKCRRGWIWTFGIPWQEVFFEFTESRSAQEPRRILRDYRGHLQTDAYAGYNAVARQRAIVRLGCWSHVRRKFYEAREESPDFTQTVLAAIQSLYRVERKAKCEGITGEDLVSLRRAQARPVLEKIERLLRERESRYLPKSLTRKAITYALRQWPALELYVDVAEAEIDNNAAENSIRGVVLGRKNWLWVGHPSAGPRAAVLLSLVESCRRLKIDPAAYLRSIIAEITEHPGRAAELTPRKWRDRERARASEKLAAEASGKSSE